jgi:hypothetical protein
MRQTTKDINRIAHLRVEIRSERLPNTNIERYR